MSAEAKKFIPGPKCIDPSLCGRLKDCQEAMVINGETRYESEKRDSSSLKYQLAISECQNEQAKMARKNGEELLNK